MLNAGPLIHYYACSNIRGTFPQVSSNDGTFASEFEGSHEDIAHEY